MPAVFAIESHNTKFTGQSAVFFARKMPAETPNGTNHRRGHARRVAELATMHLPAPGNLRLSPAISFSLFLPSSRKKRYASKVAQCLQNDS